MRISKFTEFIKESHEIELHYYALDWDDNILHMPTVIHMDKKENGSWVPVDVSTAEFAKVRNDKENYRLRNDNGDEAFSEFRDFGPRGPKAFLEDTKNALSKGSFAPAWKSFVKCLTEADLFAIITARGHEPNSIRGAVEYIIDNVLSEEERFLLYSNCLKHAYIFKGDTDVEFDRIPKGQLSKTPLISLYLDNCDYYGVSSKAFAAEFGAASASNPEHGKEEALDKFIEKCNTLGRKIGAKSVSVGFSDDDPKNVEHVRKYFKEKSALSNELQPHKVKLNLYKTTDRGIEGGERTKFLEAADGSIAPGMASSVMPYTQFNNMADNMFTNNKEYDKRMRLGTTQLAKMSKDIVKPISKKKRKIKKTKK
jgi:hypothetical protein